MNYNLFRNSDKYEAVSVNHRALITRTLTKYPVDYALFRELLQNSADAKSTSASITFESSGQYSATNPKSIRQTPIDKLVFQNNGSVFNEDDWGRLKEIAKGNPDETKIGAFGVGFYSVFELTDTPLVHSGYDVMSFHFVGDELRFAKSRSDKFIQGTLIDIPYKDSGRLPDLRKFLVFLTQSFALLPLTAVTLKLGELQLFEVKKEAFETKRVEMPAKLSKYSYDKVFKLNEPTTTEMRLDISYLNATQMGPTELSSAAGILSFGSKMVSSFFTSSEAPEEETKLVCFMHKVTATADVSVSSSFRKLMISTVLKPPSKQVVISLLTFTKNDVDRSTLKSPLSDAVFPIGFNDAKMVIGFPTKQSTGIKTHIAINQLIPTMERTAVDMSNKCVKDWNSELVYTAGILARTVYEHELKISSGRDLATGLEWASYTMKRFEMADSAPDVVIGKMFAAGFWRCFNVILLPTQLGIQPSSKTRILGKTPLSLLRSTPVLTSSEGNAFVEQIKQAGFVKDISIQDVAMDLESGPINPKMLYDLVQWAQNVPRDALTPVLNAAVVAEKDQQVLLGQVKYYQTALVPSNMPIPLTCLPYDLASKHSASALKHLGWEELQLSTWLEFVAKQPSNKFILDEQFNFKVLTLLGGSWSKLLAGERQAISRVLQAKACIPTQLGMKKPNDAYLKFIPLFPDLPVVRDFIEVPKSFLLALKVREAVDMKFVLEILHDPSSSLKWTSKDLVEYLCEHTATLQEADWQVLRMGDFFENTATHGLSSATILYFPDKKLAALGFPTLKWSGDYALKGQTSSILSKLGMRKSPSALALFEQAIRTNQVKDAIKYYLDKYSELGYDFQVLLNTKLKIVPCIDGSLSAPGDCWYDQESSLFGLKVVSRRLEEFQAQRLGVTSKPPMAKIVERLIAEPPKDFKDADVLFSYLSTRLREVSATDISKLRSARLIPVKQTMQPASNVFFSGGDAQLERLFHIIKPSNSAKSFLQLIGVQDFPSVAHIAWKTVEDPESVYNAFASSEKYLRLLVKFQTEWDTLAKDPPLVRKMKTAPFLIGDSIKDDEKVQGNLCSASNVCIVDNIILYNQFKHLILACPQETLLEEFYQRLGTANLSESLLEKATIGSRVDNTNGPMLVQHILQRLTLFLQSTTKRRRIRPSQLNDLDVVFVSSIYLERKLANTPVVKVDTTAYISRNEPNTLYLTQNPDWFDVSGVLARYTLARTDPESVIVLELQLSSSLDSLQRKGYNVSRLLNQKREAEEKLRVERAEQERARQERARQEREHEREQQQAVEQARAQQLKQSQKATPSVQPPRNQDLVPQSPQQQPQPPVQPPGGDASLKAPGMPSMSDANVSKSLTGMLSSLFKEKPKRPPMATAPSIAAPNNTMPSPTVAQNSGGPMAAPNHTNTPSEYSASSTMSTLNKGIQCSQAFSSDHINTPKHVDVPAPPVLSSCESQVIYDYKVGAKLNDGLRLFVQKSAGSPNDHNVAMALQFSGFLQQCCKVYNAPYSCVSIFIGPTKSIAFNTRGSLFFNLLVFEMQVLEGWDPARQLDFWFTVMAHELAHNLVSDHGEHHSYYTESYIQFYLQQFRQLQVRYQ